MVFSERGSPRKDLHPDDKVRSLACYLLHHAEFFYAEHQPGVAPGRSLWKSDMLLLNITGAF